MSKRLLGLNVLLAAVSLACLVYIVRGAIVTPRAPAPPPRATAPTILTAPLPGAVSRPPSQGYSVVATRNLFSPARTEATSAPPLAGVPAVQKPSLYGVVLRDGAPIAYLDDPVTRRGAGYRLGDSIAGGTVQTITADRVVIARPGGTVDVLLHDPVRPRPTAEPAGPNIIRRPPPSSPDAPPR